MTISIGSTLKPNHLEETNPEDDAGAIEVRLTPRASRNHDIDACDENSISVGSQASNVNVNVKGKPFLYWMWRGLGTSALLV
ncbi:hypothetical protein ACHAXM_000165, partial [Skeletonema potamos]